MTMNGRCWIATFGLALMTAACGAGETFDAGERARPIKRVQTPENEFNPAELEAAIDDLIAEINESSLEPMEMAVLLKQLDNFFAPIATGASRAMGELEVTGNVIGPIGQGDSATSMDLQNQQIDQMVADGVEGIGVSPFGDQNAAAIDEAVAKGVHVVTLDTDQATSTRSLYVGALNRSAGATAAETLLDMLPPPPGTVMVHGNIGPEWVDGFERTQGAQGVFEAAGYTVLVTQAVFVTDDTYDVDWMKPQIEAADPPVVGMLGLFNISYRCAMAAEAAGLHDIPVVAFDFDPKTVDFMRKGRIKATHAQRQYYEGYLVPYILYGIGSIGLDETKKILAPQMADGSRVNLGLDVVPAEKIDAYYSFLNSIGAEQ